MGLRRRSCEKVKVTRGKVKVTRGKVKVAREKVKVSGDGKQD